LISNLLPRLQFPGFSPNLPRSRNFDGSRLSLTSPTSLSSYGSQVDLLSHNPNKSFRTIFEFSRSPSDNTIAPNPRNQTGNVIISPIALTVSRKRFLTYIMWCSSASASVSDLPSQPSAGTCERLQQIRHFVFGGSRVEHWTLLGQARFGQGDRLARRRVIVEAIALMARIIPMMATTIFQSPSAGLGIARATSAPRAPTV